MAGENPFEQFQLNPNSGLRNEYMQMRMMNSENRMMPGLRAPRYGGRSGLDHANPMMAGMLGGQGQEDYSQFTYNPQAREAASKYLGQYGLAPLAPDQVKQNAVLPNSGFFGNHPRLAAGLEGAMFGAASTRGSDSIGEGISNVAAGLIEGPQMRRNLINRQFATPFQAANMFEQMEDKQAMRKYRDAEIQHLDAENERYKHDKSYTAIPASASSIMEFNPMTGQNELHENKFYDPKTANTPDLDPAKRFFDTKTREFQEKNPGKMPSSKDLGDWQDEWRSKSTPDPAPQKPQRELYRHQDGKIFELKEGYTLQPGDKPLRQEEAKPYKDDAARKRYIESASKNPLSLFMMNPNLDITDGAAVAKYAGEYYDQNISSGGENSPMPDSGTPTWDPTTRKLKK